MDTAPPASRRADQEPVVVEDEVPEPGVDRQVVDRLGRVNDRARADAVRPEGDDPVRGGRVEHQVDLVVGPVVQEVDRGQIDVPEGRAPATVRNVSVLPLPKLAKSRLSPRVDSSQSISPNSSWSVPPGARRSSR